MKRFLFSKHKGVLYTYKYVCLLCFFLIVNGSDILARTTSDKSLYDYLKSDGHFNTYVRLIDDLNYTEVFSQTGNLTLFAANDASYASFFSNNAWNVTGYEQLTPVQKKYLLKFSMINNGWALSDLTSITSDGNYINGSAMRHKTFLRAMDSILFLKGNQLPDNIYWKPWRNNGIHFLSDNSDIPTLFLTQSYLDKHGVTDEDLKIILGIENRAAGDVHVFNNKVVTRDIACKNGYINVLQHVQIPPVNMEQYIAGNNTGDASQTTKIFAKWLDHFCAPYYDANSSLIYRTLFPGLTDSIFTKKYFALLGGTSLTPTVQSISTLLPFSPGWNSYTYGRAMEEDMAAMFVPSDGAINDYFSKGVGAIIKNRFHGLDSIPNTALLPFLRRCMRFSLIKSLPNRFGKLVDTENYSFPVRKEDIIKTYTGVNGVVFVVDKVYPPVDYNSVLSPVFISQDTKIMNWTIQCNSSTTINGVSYSFFKTYLNSQKGNYSLFIPTDQYFTQYIDPIAYGQDVPGVLKFWYNNATSAVNATAYKYNKTTGMVGDSVGVIVDKVFILNRLWHLLNNHIVVGNVENGAGYYTTRGNDLIKVSGSGSSLTVQGGEDLSKNARADVLNRIGQANGTTYFINKPIEPSLRSAYKVLSETPQFSKFFELLDGVPDTYFSQIFSQQGMDKRVSFFNAFHYTIYVPTNEAIEAAVNNGSIIPWSQINAMTSENDKSNATLKLIRFLRYHFQDKAVFFGQTVNGKYVTATIKMNDTESHWSTGKNKFYKIGVAGASNSMTLTTENNSTANVVTQDGLYNIIVKDYVFAKTPASYKNIDGTGSATGAAFLTSSITTSSSAVIHQIDNVLTFE